MEKYEVRINLNSISYEIEATNEEEAIAQAYELALQESQYDLLKWADYEATLWEG
jgi:hypothetical protein